MQDPNPLIAGKGIKILRDAGIEVISGILEDEAKWLNRFFIKHITKGIPYIVAKVAQSLDGKIATIGGDSKWISSEESRIMVHKMRSEIDAILVGRNTVDTDNPELTVRAVEGRNPVRVILDSNLSINLNANVLKDCNDTKTIICTSRNVLNTDKAKILESSGIQIQAVNTNSDGKIDLQKCLKLLLDNYKIASILVEGGTEVLSSFLKAKLIDELHIFLAPIIIGKGKGTFDSININKVSDSYKLLLKSAELSAQDLHLIYLQE
jgi:diaminohydroxyphosphoribosylaminopyrimidine deaminase/5-amino-6-(5-phosphoribosylamino)uracil reductase